MISYPIAHVKIKEESSLSDIKSSTFAFATQKKRKRRPAMQGSATKQMAINIFSKPAGKKRGVSVRSTGCFEKLFARLMVNPSI